ncbi:PiggyBac transposable element-derived protein 4 [Araneus ventricosus]|uniref:PiggyBac transposable element-derived protein 4 n=1 Tax=Araneus ventricosus TaxID=182803 RepID=A0A4Y2D053_ARAVE|nr:PiggyBac transposable element-derived protein 4 [Araneus ventricosus]
MLMQRFQSTYIPKQDISIDESLIGYKGRLGWKQYIPTKRSRFGVKLFQLCESESGYIWNSIIHTGKGTTFHEDYEDYGVSTKSVMTLNHELKNKGYTLTTDNYYTSPELAEILIKCKTDIYGTLRENRKGLPQLIKSSKVKKCEVLAFQKGKICLLKWTDKKTILMLSTLHSTSMVTVESKKSKSSKLKPEVVADYNNTMGGVDKADQCLSYYPVARNQQRKYYKNIFRYLLSQAVWNAFVIFKKNGEKMRQVEFRMKLIERLIEVTVCNPSTRRGPFPKSEENVVRLTGRHFPSYVDESESRKKSRKCVVFSLKINENVGAGSAGSVLASRLSEDPFVKVLLLEAGGYVDPVSEIPAAAFLTQLTDNDWQFLSTPQKRAGGGYPNRGSCSNLALQVWKLAASLSRQDCKFITSLKKLSQASKSPYDKLKTCSIKFIVNQLQKDNTHTNLGFEHWTTLLPTCHLNHYSSKNVIAEEGLRYILILCLDLIFDKFENII